MIKAPAVLLCFDDCHIGAWHDYLQFFDDHQMKVTFYLSDIAGIRLKNHGWEKLQELRSHGHTIAYHGLNHLRAGTTVDKEGCEAFMAREVWAGLEILKEEGFDNVRHYCYPYGNCNEASDKCLLECFDTLRKGGRESYSLEQMRNIKVFASSDFGKFSERKLCGHEGFLESAMVQRRIVSFHMHIPVRHRLEYIFEHGKRHGLKFYPLEILNSSISEKEKNVDG